MGDLSECWLTASRTIHKSSSIAGITRSCSEELKHLIDIATWFWRGSRKCGPNYRRLARAKRRQSQSTRIGSFPRCFSEETQLFLSSRILSLQQNLSKNIHEDVSVY